MPPQVYPRAIQVARTLKAINELGWQIDVVANDPGPTSTVVNDTVFAQRYAGFYRIHAVASRDPNSKHKTIVRRASAAVKRFIVPQYDEVADVWRADAEAKVHDIIRYQPPDAFVTFAQPWVDHLIGLRVKARHRALPWVAHFSDPWVDSLYNEGLGWRLLRMWRRLERAVIRSADEVVFVSDRTADLVMKKYPASWRNKVHVVPHGYDLDLRDGVRNARAAESGDRLQFTYTGNLYGNRHPLALLDALIKIRREHPRFPVPKLKFVGHSLSEHAARAKELGISDLVEFLPSVGYFEALEFASAADVLLIVDAKTESSVFFPSKLVDYLMFGKPILALSPPDGVTADILSRLGHVCVAPDDVDEVAAAVMSLVERFGHGKPSFQVPSEYDINSTTTLFESAIETAIGRKPHFRQQMK